jgi:hypothetical protein
VGGKDAAGRDDDVDSRVGDDAEAEQGGRRMEAEDAPRATDEPRGAQPVKEVRLRSVEDVRPAERPGDATPVGPPPHRAAGHACAFEVGERGHPSLADQRARVEPGVAIEIHAAERAWAGR